MLPHRGQFALGCSRSLQQWKWPIGCTTSSHLVGRLPTLGAGTGEARHLSQRRCSNPGSPVLHNMVTGRGC